MQRTIFLIAAIFGVLGVSLGAFGAHALKQFLTDTGSLATYETAVRYQFYHTLLLILVGILMFRIDSKWLKYSALSIILGVLFFSGSLYLLCFTQQAFWGPITPIGGLLLILGWGFLGLAIFNFPFSKNR